jgi:hypothetical protein
MLSRGTNRGRRVAFVVAMVASAWALVAAAAAQATTITVGSVLPAGWVPQEFKEARTLFNSALPESGANLVSPVNGAIVRWRMQGSKGGPFHLRVLHPNGSGAYTAAGTSGAAMPTSEGLQTFSANIPVRAGDLVGVDPTNPGDTIGVATVAGARYASIFPSPFEGATVAPSSSIDGQEIELSAEVQPQPAVKSLSIESGQLTGGAKVVITGSELEGASAVEFGEAPAASFTVDSETQITAVAPKATVTGAVPVTVKTIAGTSEAVSGSRFYYEGCVVPRLRSKNLQRTKRALGNSGCRLGKVKKPKGVDKSNGIVASQSKTQGKILHSGAKIDVTLKLDPKKQAKTRK